MGPKKFAILSIALFKLVYTKKIMLYIEASERGSKDVPTEAELNDSNLIVVTANLNYYYNETSKERLPLISS